ncbi:uncharacterized protein [Rutidosis leptorrhynchoides]|uniref:uncharacterized protein n=1 Tax=Rutidosis leptorrhynchoides TaxID=125765 RepID=UPI003A99130F
MKDMARLGINLDDTHKCKSCGSKAKPRPRRSSRCTDSHLHSISEEEIREFDTYFKRAWVWGQGEIRWVGLLWGSSDFGYIQKEVVGNSGGMLLIWDTKSFKASSTMCSEYFLAVRGNWVGSGKDSIIVNIYGPHDDASKKVMWRSLDSIMLGIDSAWVLCGDFNEVRVESDRKNCEFIRRRASRFNDFINRNKLIEIPINGRKFTRISDDGVKFSKLDRFLISDLFLDLWNDLSVAPLDRILDHFPLILRDKIVDYGPKLFKVFNVWFQKDGVDNIIQGAWGKPVTSRRLDCIFRDKLKNVKFALKKWSNKEFGNLDNEINNRKEKEAAGLEDKFCETEIWEAIKECGSLKAPGPDEFNLKFYKKYWELIKIDLLNAINSFWDKGEFSNGCTASFITLVPKKTDPTSLNEYRPISLIGSYYKIVTKVLSNRLRKVVPKLVGNEQSAFIKEVMEFMGFGVRWRHWIPSCLKSASISVLVNGSPTSEFKLERGVRQGDPLSPFLFILAAEGLNALTKAAVNSNLFVGCEISCDKICVSHLQYADDTIYFGDWI